MAGLSKKDRASLPSTLERSEPHAQEIFVQTRRSAEATYDEPGAASRVAYSSLKRAYEKVGDHWEPKDHRGPSDAQSARHDRGKVDHPSPTAGGVDAGATKAHLLGLARRLDVRGRSRMSRPELVDAIDAANRAATRQAR